MADEKSYTLKEFHARMASDLFNLTWDLLDKTDRTPADNDKMIHAAHASRFHWGEIGTALNLARGEWQVSRVYATLGRPEPALYHGRRSLELCEQNGIADFDLAFAHEALARGYALAGDTAKAQAHIAAARKAAEAIAKAEDRDYFLSQLKSVPDA